MPLGLWPGKAARQDLRARKPAYGIREVLRGVAAGPGWFF